jgi:hypothetical protein
MPTASSSSGSPRDAAAACEEAPPTPSRRERFVGWGVMGLTFASGDVLGLRRFPVSSIGPGYTSVWHRSPQGDWRFWSTVAGEQSCARYVGEPAADAGATAITLAWPAPDRLTIAVDEPELVWEVRLAATAVTRSLGAVARRLPGRTIGSARALRLLGAAAGPPLGAGRLALTGRMPNGQVFHVLPTHLWRVSSSRATLAGRDLGTPAPLREPAALGDFRIPQSGLLAVAVAEFDPGS